jgi:transcriptional regulator with XRE-family HTH domain
MRLWRRIQPPRDLLYKDRFSAGGGCASGAESSRPDHNTVVTVESGTNPNPTIETLTKIAKALNVGVDDLIK